MLSSLKRYSRRVPFRWFAGVIAVIGLAVSGLFHGLAPVGAGQTPTIAVGKVIDAGPWNVTIVDTRLISSTTGLQTTTKGDHWIAVVATLDDTTSDSREDMADFIRIPHVTGLRTPAPQEVLLASDATFLGYLNPGMPERVAFLWEQSSKVQLPKTVDVVVYGETLRQNSLDGTTEWLSPHVVAYVNAPVQDKRT